MNFVKEVEDVQEETSAQAKYLSRAKERASGKRGSLVAERRNKMRTYCFKCRKEVDVKDPIEITLRNGQSMTRGICSVCGAKVLKVLLSETRELIKTGRR